jgi:starch synthase (maltosyl-transferring)
MTTAKNPPLIYNLFPRLVGDMSRWSGHLERAALMGFDWIYVNPIHYPGFSGSLYAVKDFYRLNPLFIPENVQDPEQVLRRTLEHAHRLGLRVMMDLVINHTAKDSLLVAEHPTWFRRDAEGEVLSPSAIDPADARKVTVWGDLAEADNESSPDREALHAYWTSMALHHLALGFDGFRCDAAYKVPPDLWSRLVSAVRSRRPDFVFVAETLGCRLKEVRQLAGVGFDYLINSSKYWAFDAPWCLEQHEEFSEIAPSISFPESHDTPRLMEETGGNLRVQKQRYAFCAFFSAGLLVPVGFEFGFRKRLNVVQTRPEDWEATGIDLTGFIREVNTLKRKIPVLSAEGHWEVVTSLGQETTLLRKRGAPSESPVLLAINKDWQTPRTLVLPRSVLEDGSASWMRRPCLRVGEATEAVPRDGHLLLEAAEVVVLGRAG